MGTTMIVNEPSAGVVGSSAPGAATESWRSLQNSWAPRRRSSRVTLDLPVELYGQGADGLIFHEQTRTRVVSAHGALISLATDVALGQAVVLVSKRTRQEMHCRVVYREEVAKGEVYVGVAFLTPAPRFWGVIFPPEDWDSAERKRSGIPVV